jgi:hypothetical protein
MEKNTKKAVNLFVNRANNVWSVATKYLSYHKGSDSKEMEWLWKTRNEQMCHCKWCLHNSGYYNYENCHQKTFHLL